MASKISGLLDTSGKWLLGCSPLLLALVFQFLFLFFDRHLGLEHITWQGTDRHAVAVAKAVETAEAAVREAQANLVKARAAEAPAKPTTESAIKEANTALTEANAALKKATDAAIKVPVSPTTSEVTLRLCWGVACTLFAFLLVLIGVRSIREIDDVAERSSPGAPRAKRVCLLTSLSVLAVAVWLGLTWWDGETVVSNLAGRPATQLFEHLQGKDSGLAASDAAGLAKVKHLGLMINLLSHGAMVALLLIAAAASAIVWNLYAKLRGLPGALTKVQLDAEAHWLRVTTSRATVLMQLTAIALIAGVIEVLLLYLLTSHHVGPTLQADVRLFAQMIAFAGGLVYSGLLVAIFLPVYEGIKSLDAALAHQLEQIATAQAAAAIAVGGPAPVMPDSFDVTDIPIIKSLTALLSPVLVAVGAALFGTVKELLLQWF